MKVALGVGLLAGVAAAFFLELLRPRRGEWPGLDRSPHGDSSWLWGCEFSHSFR